MTSLWVRGRRRGHHPTPHRMPFNKMSFFQAATAIERALLLGCGRSQYTGYCTNVINTTAPEKRARRSSTASAPRLARKGGTDGALKAAYTCPSAPPKFPPRAQSERRRRATACPHSVEGLGDVSINPHGRLACRLVGCSGEVVVVLAAVTFGGRKRHEAYLRFVTQKAGHSSVLAVLGDRGNNVDAFQNRHPKKRLVPTPAVSAISPH